MHGSKYTYSHLHVCIYIYVCMIVSFFCVCKSSGTAKEATFWRLDFGVQDLSSGHGKILKQTRPSWLGKFHFVVYIENLSLLSHYLYASAYMCMCLYVYVHVLVYV